MTKQITEGFSVSFIINAHSLDCWTESYNSSGALFIDKGELRIQGVKAYD